MAEPTLGARILDAATWWTECVDSGDQAGQGDAQTALRALCARADAAERLAVAVAVVRREAPGQEHQQFIDSINEWERALAAWRAINGEAG